MRMFAVALGLLVALPALAQDAAPKPGPEKLDIAVLYAGAPGHKRTGKWMQFLQARCRKAGTVALDAITEEAAKGYDVVVVDSPSPYGKGRAWNMPKVRVPADFGRPLVLLGAAGGSVLTSRKIKLDWL